ncbi:TonB-dependent receptor plug domain-containing protein [Agarilytica rhodophyticola]|uniref:TonB-dependent receptor plug domain-containing protein n=1 Tax=Agarilytica rhodophyticola TaxID=1737490 RepID=UPI000B349F06|nr:TonB-dependent receptor [Agarilytica rhodophyticola]
MKRTKLSAAISSAIGITLAPLLFSNNALAQQSENLVEEEVLVTGSRLSRPDLDSVSPMTVIGSEEFKISGNINVEQKLAELPSTNPSFGASSNNPGDGTARVDLRGLGAFRTLVLVNGRRYIPATQTGIVDLNSIPGTLIKQVDVVTGGASAVYGSDALAGVVNFQLVDDFEGVEVTGLYDITTEGDAERYNMDITIGGNFDDGRGNAVLYASFLNRDPLFQGDRDFSSVTLTESNGTLVNGGSSRVPEGRVSGAGFLVDPDGVPNSGDEFDTAIFSPTGAAREFLDPEDRFNFAPDNYLQLPQERYLISTIAHYDINESVRAYSELAFSQNTVPQQLAPTPAATSVFLNPDSPLFDAATRSALDAIRTDTNNDGVVDGNDNAPVSITRRMVEVGPRQVVDERDAFRLLVGVNGEITDNWNFDAYYSKSSLNRINLLENDISRSRLLQGLAVTDDGTACQDTSNGCVPVNIFGAGNITEAAANFIRIGATNVTTIDQEVIQANISGELFTISSASNPVSILFGYEHREDESSFRPDTFLSSGDVLGFNAGQPTVGKYSVDEFFTEFNVPLVEGQPLVESLSLWGAYRYSDYSNVGGTSSYATAFNYAPTDKVTFRVGFQEAVRAPNVSELFLGQSNGFPSATDPCSADGFITGTTDAALCEATGVPAGQAGVFDQQDSQIEGIFGGNPDLQEETSNTFTIGAVIQPIEGLDISIDYYDIEIEDAIDTFGGGVNNTLNLCYNVFRDASNPACQAVTRQSDGNVDTVTVLNENIGKIETSGIDLNINYVVDLNESTLAFNFVSTYLDTWDETPVASQPNIVNECAGAFGSICDTNILPDVVANLRTTWSIGNLSLSALVRYIGEAEDDQIVNGGDTSDIVVPKVDAEVYLDLNAAYSFSEDFRVNFGVNNALDTEPTPLGDNSEQANTFPETYNLLGPRVFVSASYKFR